MKDIDFCFPSIDIPCAWVRISREQQLEVDAETLDTELALESAGAFPKRGAIPKRGRKRQTTSLPSSDADEAENAVPRRMHLNATLIRRLISAYNDEAIAQGSTNEARTRMERLEEVWRDLDKEWNASAGSTISNADLNICSEFFGQITEEYLHFKAKLRDRIGQAPSLVNSRTAPGQATAVAASGQVIHIQMAEAPKVPKFSGLEVDWANFRAIFDVEVHTNPRFTNTQKMHLLLASLQGRAAKAYANWPIINDTSYELLWAEICKQYSNEYNTIRAHLQALHALKPMQQPTGDLMRQIIDTARGSFRQLQLLLKPEQVAEYMLLHQLEVLLDAEGRTQWNLRRTAETLPNLSQMFSFMQLRAGMLDATTAAPLAAPTAGPTIGARRSAPLGSTNLVAQRGLSIGRGDEPHPSCDLCVGQTHWPFKCPRFRAKSVIERTNYVTTRRMCTNCFSLKHFSKMCPDTLQQKAQQLPLSSQHQEGGAGAHAKGN